MGERQAVPPRDRSEPFVLFKKPFQVKFSMLSSVLGTVAIAEQAVGMALKELTI